MNDELAPRTQTTALVADTESVLTYLQRLGLPTDNVIATTEERNIVATNLPPFLASLDATQKGEARYLAKFVGASAIGLFDAALNYIWNEVVLNLRTKAELYGLDLFFDAAVGGNARTAFQTADDLAGLKDNVLLNTCRKLELISDIVYRKLDHILTMRNEVAASHPNVERIGGFELLGWLQTCVREVISDQPSQSSIQARALIENICARATLLTGDEVAHVASAVSRLSTAHTNNLLIRLFGIFVDPSKDQILRHNIAQIAKSVWNGAEANARLRVGIMLDRCRVNLEQVRAAHGLTFLREVDGLEYQTLGAKVTTLQHVAEQLSEAHDGWDNFYHEPAFIEEILRYCKKSSDIPPQVYDRLVEVVLRCRIGRGVTWNNGVSPAGRPGYDRFLGILDDTGIAACVRHMCSPRLASKLQNPVCQSNLREVVLLLRGIAISDRLKEILDFIAAHIKEASSLSSRPDFRQLTSSHIRWQ